MNKTELGEGPQAPTVYLPGDPIGDQLKAWEEEAALPYYEPRFKRLRVVLPAMLAAILGAIAAIISMHLFTTPQTLTVTKIETVHDQNPDDKFAMELSQHGLNYNGSEVVRQRWMEFAHHTCYQLMPPNPQPFEPVALSIQSASAADAKLGDNPWEPLLSLPDAENLARSAVDAYCPQLSGRT